VDVNQQTNGGDWFSIGQYDGDGTASDTVE